MARSPFFQRLQATLCKAETAETLRVSTSEALERIAEADGRRSRREFLRDATLMAVALAAPSAFGARNAPTPRIAIIGGGLAGLACADRLRAKRLSATIYEAGTRLGGRCYSLRGLFPGQVAEYGGEFIDTSHHTMRNYANEFGLALENVENLDGDSKFYVNGANYSEEEVIDQHRVLVARMRNDIRTLSNEPTFFDHTPGDAAFDNLSLKSYLDTRASDLPLIREVLDIAYVSEYGLETDQQSALNFLLFIHADRRSKFTPFGTSDERFHVVDGNDRIAQGIAQRLPGPIEMGMKLTRLKKLASGEIEMMFANGQTKRADYVIVAIPFTVLRGVTLDSSLGLSADKLRAIQTMGYGNNAKTMLGFNGRPWHDLHDANGEALTDQPNAQNTWETNPSRAGATSVLTDYAGGERGRTLAQSDLNTRVNQFLSSMEPVFPGLSARYNNKADRFHWPSNPLSLGSYTAYLPGQFTGIAGLESQPAGPLKFAGEHTDSFYSYQGFMEGACLSGIRAANEVIADVRR